MGEQGGKRGKQERGEDQGPISLVDLVQTVHLCDLYEYLTFFAFDNLAWLNSADLLLVAAFK